MLLCLGTDEFTWAEGSSYSSGVGITWVKSSGLEQSAVIVECMNVYLDSEPNTLLVSPFIEDVYSTWPWEVRNDQSNPTDEYCCTDLSEKADRVQLISHYL